MSHCELSAVVASEKVLLVHVGFGRSGMSAADIAGHGGHSGLWRLWSKSCAGSGALAAKRYGNARGAWRDASVVLYYNAIFSFALVGSGSVL